MINCFINLLVDFFTEVPHLTKHLKANRFRQGTPLR